MFSLFLVASSTAKNACATSYGWTCCSPNSGDPGTDPNCGKPGQYPCAKNPSCDACGPNEKKNMGSCPANDAACKAKECTGENGRTVANSCVLNNDPGSGNSSVCRYATVTPSSLTLKAGQSFVLRSNAFAGAQIGSMTATSSVPSVASVSPSLVNLCCEWKYSYRAIPVPTTVFALREGTTRVVTTFHSGSDSCYNSSRITVSGSVDPLSCVPGATCTSNTGSFSVGSVVSCRMPEVTDLSWGTPTYQVRCTPYKGDVAQRVAAKNSTNGVFANTYTVARGVTAVACSFRYCQTTSSGVITCSNWGSAN